MKHRIIMDLDRAESGKQIDVMQDDKYSRELELYLRANGMPYCPPKDCQVLVRYQKSNGQGGAYDRLPDGTKAWNIQENVLTVALAPQVCTVPGQVLVTVTLRYGSAELSCFAVCVNVGKGPNSGLKSESYYHISGFIPQPDRAVVGDYLKVAAVDAQGNITAMTALAGDFSGSEIHIGTEAPTEVNVNLWIDTDEEPDWNIPTDEHIISIVKTVLAESSNGTEVEA